MTCGFQIYTLQSLQSHTKSAVSFDMYSQQFTLCYFLVKSPLLRIRFYNFLRHQSVSGASPPKKNPGSAPGKSYKQLKTCLSRMSSIYRTMPVTSGFAYDKDGHFSWEMHQFIWNYRFPKIVVSTLAAEQRLNTFYVFFWNNQGYQARFIIVKLWFN